jgi:hypothetical protein
MYPKFSELANAIGALPALTLCAFNESSLSLYVPERYIPGHLLERVLGQSAFLDLIRAFGSETIFPPSMHLNEVRRTGLICQLTRRGLSSQQIAALTDIGPARVRQVQIAFLNGAPMTQLARAENMKAGDPVEKNFVRVRRLS